MTDIALKKTEDSQTLSVRQQAADSRHPSPGFDFGKICL